MANVEQGPSAPASASKMGRWALGLGGTWVVLSFMVDLGWGEVASALALVIASGVLLDQGPRALENLGFLTK